MVGTHRGAAPGIQSGVSPARASSATWIAMRLPPRLSGIPATVAAVPASEGLGVSQISCFGSLRRARTEQAQTGTAAADWPEA